MRLRLATVFVTTLMLCACMAKRNAIDEVAPPVPAGITPLTIEQDDQLAS